MKKKIITLACICLFVCGVIPVTAYERQTSLFSTQNNLELMIQKASAMDSYDLLIIAHDSWKDELQSFQQHKENHGIRTIVVGLNEIYSGTYFVTEGRDNAEQIKYFIKNALDTWDINYVLFFGDIDSIPMRKSYATGTLWSFQYILTDLYYADIYNQTHSFCSWDSNNNNIFGEFTWDVAQNTTMYIDAVDLYPDVGVGRLPVSNTDEVTTVVNKIIQYESQPADPQWFNRLILMGGDTFPNMGGSEGEIVTAYITAHMTSFNPVKLWMSLNTFNPRTINTEISKGAGFVSFSGHGHWWGLYTNRFNKSYFGTYYFTPYILGLTNGEKLPVMFFDCCLTADLDVRLFNMKIPCFAWALVKKQSGGAIATIGFTESPFAGIVGDPLGGGSSLMNANFFDAYKPGIFLSDMLSQAQYAYIDHNIWKECLVIEQCTLIGDPSLKIGGYNS